MTVNTTDITSGPYTGNGVADEFSYTFRIEDKSQVRVFETTDAGVETELTVDTDYTVAGIGNDAGGLITRVAGALPSNYTWFIRSNYQATQNTAFESQGGFFPDVHESSFDKLTFLVQQILDQLGRTLKFGDTIQDFGDGNDLGDFGANQYLGTSPDGTTVDWIALNQTPLTGSIAYIANRYVFADFTIGGGTSAVTLLTENTPGANLINVFVNGVRQLPVTDYAETSSTVLTLQHEIESTDVVDVYTGVLNATAVTLKTDAQLNDISDDINTADKFAGKSVFNSDQGYPVYASGSSAAATWNRYSNDAVSNTPV